MRVFKALFLWKLAHAETCTHKKQCVFSHIVAHTRGGNVFSHRHLHKRTCNFFLVKMAELWRRQLLQQLQDNLDDDEGEELFLARFVHMLASDIAKAPQ